MCGGGGGEMGDLRGGGPEHFLHRKGGGGPEMLPEQ